MPEPKIRLDKWLWHARFFKTCTLAAKVVSGAHVRVNGTKVTKPATTVTIGAVLTFPQANQIRVIKINALGARRGPASEAQSLYEDLSTPEDKTSQDQTPRAGARPTKKDRRSLDLIRSRTLD